jgi:serine/threonine-protein kinase
MAVMSTQVLAGRYVLGEVLGTGGMATVRRATDQVLGREVAVKILSPQYAAHPGFLARFEREARHAAALSHPRLVTVFDCGIDDGTAFIVMELVAGRTLRQVLDDAGILPPEEAVAIAAAVCEGLEVAHAAGLVHRDIKPENIVLSGGEVKILDFGIARADSTAGGTRTMGVLGTVAYLSPEQVSGGPARRQSDLYSLGCVLFEMLTGEPPFASDSAMGLAYRHVHDDPGPPSARQPGVPAQLDGITGQLLAKHPAARPASAAAARAGLLAALNPDAAAVIISPDEDVVPSGLSRRRFRRLTQAEVVLAGTLAAALAALAAVLVSGTTAHAAPGAAPSVSPSASHRASTSPPAAYKAYEPAHLRPGPMRSVRPGATQPAQPGPTQSAQPGPTQPAVGQANTLPPVAAAAATFVGDLEAGVTDGQVAPPAGQDLYNHLQHLLFGPPDQTPQQIQQQYAQLVQAYNQDRSHGQIRRHAAKDLRHALAALRAALGAA